MIKPKICWWWSLSPRQKAALAPAGVVQVVLAGAAGAVVASRPASQVRGAEWRWATLVAVNYAGPFAYFRWGRRRDNRVDAR
jgi:hypothetical protein